MRKMILGLVVLASLMCVETLGLTKGKNENLDKKCNNGDSEACMELGSYYSQEFFNNDRDIKKAISYYEKICKKGNEGDENFLDACYLLGKIYRDGPRIQENYKKALELFTMTCSKDYGYFERGGCGEVLKLYAKGRGVQKDPDEGAALLKKLCDGGNAIYPCYHAAEYELQKGNKREATRYYKKACERSDGEGRLFEEACDKYDDLK